MTSDETVKYYRGLMQSNSARSYWVGTSPDDEAERWFFETIEDGDELVVVRQLAIEADGKGHRYSVDHFEDEWGFLTDQPLALGDGLARCSSEDFEAAWAA